MRNLNPSIIVIYLLYILPLAQCSAQVAPSKSRAKPSAVVNGMKNFACSGLAAACSKTLLAPFDTIKTVQQQARSGGKALGLFEASRVITSRPSGFWELYAGLAASALGAMPSVGLYFGVYSYSKEKILPILTKTLEPDNESSDAIVRTITIASSAAIGNTIASFSRVPYEVLKQKLQTGEYSSTIGAITDMCRTGGARAFFPTGGVSIQMIRDIPYAIVTLLTYEALREHWVNKREKAAWRDMVAGGLAGGTGSFATNPMDVIKTRVQTDSALYGGSVMTCAKATYAEGGASAFLRGSVPRLIHKIPANGAFFVFYELFRRLFNVQDDLSTRDCDVCEENE